jgi:hypothetical protein
MAPLASPGNLGLAVGLIVAVYAIVATGIVVAVVWVGARVYRTSRGSARNAVLLSPVIAALLIATWYVLLGVVELPIVMLMFGATATTAVMSCVVYALVRARIVWRVAGIVGALGLGLIALDIGVARRTDDPRALRIAAHATEHLHALFRFSMMSLGTPDLGVWVAKNPATPADALLLLTQSTDINAQWAALHNPSLSVSVRDSLIRRYQDLAPSH